MGGCLEFGVCAVLVLVVWCGQSSVALWLDIFTEIEEFAQRVKVRLEKHKRSAPDNASDDGASTQVSLLPGAKKPKKEKKAKKERKLSAYNLFVKTNMKRSLKAGSKVTEIISQLAAAWKNCSGVYGCACMCEGYAGLCLRLSLARR